jgi:hypothetical protein
LSIVFFFFNYFFSLIAANLITNYSIVDATGKTFGTKLQARELPVSEFAAGNYYFIFYNKQDKVVGVNKMLKQ